MSVLKKIVYYITLPIRYLFLGFIYFYKYAISPILPKTCRFTPSCSEYSLKAFKEYGILGGISKSTCRILRCNPFNKKTGFDPLKENLKGDIKWVF